MLHETVRAWAPACTCAREGGGGSASWGATQPLPTPSTRLLGGEDRPTPSSPPTEAPGGPQPAPTVARRHSSEELGLFDPRPFRKPWQLRADPSDAFQRAGVICECWTRGRCAWEGGRARSPRPHACSRAAPQAVREGHAARTSRAGKVGLQEVEEAGAEVEEGLLDRVERGVAEDRPRWPMPGHRSRASVSAPPPWPN